jgi:hypothetical protein
MDRTPELADELAECTRHISEGHARIARQREIIGHLSDGGHDVTEAESVLHSMLKSLEMMEAHRQHILRKWSWPRRAVGPEPDAGNAGGDARSVWPGDRLG